MSAEPTVTSRSAEDQLLLEHRIQAIKRKNEELKRRHLEVEADKILAAKQNALVQLNSPHDDEWIPGGREERLNIQYLEPQSPPANHYYQGHQIENRRNHVSEGSGKNDFSSNRHEEHPSQPQHTSNSPALRGRRSDFQHRRHNSGEYSGGDDHWRSAGERQDYRSKSPKTRGREWDTDNKQWANQSQRNNNFYGTRESTVTSKVFKNSAIDGDRGRKPNFRLGDGDGPPPDPSYSYLGDDMRDSAEVIERRQGLSSRRGSPRGQGFNRGGRPWNNKRFSDKIGQNSDQNEPEKPKGEPPQYSYEAWRQERNKIDQDRINRQKTSDGSWSREWDSDKVYQSEEHNRADWRSGSRTFRHHQGSRDDGGKPSYSSRPREGFRDEDERHNSNQVTAHTPHREPTFRRGRPSFRRGGGCTSERPVGREFQSDRNQEDGTGYNSGLAVPQKPEFSPSKKYKDPPTRLTAELHFNQSTLSPETRILSPETKVPSPETKLSSPEAKVWSPETKVWSPETKMWSPETKVWSPETKVSSPETKVPSPKTMVPSLETKVSSPEMKVPSPEMEVPSPRKVTMTGDQMKISSVSDGNEVLIRRCVEDADGHLRISISTGSNASKIANSLPPKNSRRKVKRRREKLSTLISRNSSATPEGPNDGDGSWEDLSSEEGEISKVFKITEDKKINISCSKSADVSSGPESLDPIPSSSKEDGFLWDDYHIGGYQDSINVNLNAEEAYRALLVKRAEEEEYEAVPRCDSQPCPSFKLDTKCLDDSDNDSDPKLDPLLVTTHLVQAEVDKMSLPPIVNEASLCDEQIFMMERGDKETGTELEVKESPEDSSTSNEQQHISAEKLSGPMSILEIQSTQPTSSDSDVSFLLVESPDTPGKGMVGINKPVTETGDTDKSMPGITGEPNISDCSVSVCPCDVGPKTELASEPLKMEEKTQETADGVAAIGKSGPTKDALLENFCTTTETVARPNELDGSSEIDTYQEESFSVDPDLESRNRSPSQKDSLPNPIEEHVVVISNVNDTSNESSQQGGNGVEGDHST